MSKKIKNTKTVEERRAQADALQASITDQVEQFRNSDEWLRFLDFTRSFHSYSFNNLILIMTQFPTASHVAGFRQWQAKGRQVRKGEKSIRIFGFAEKKTRHTDDPDGQDETADGETGQRVVRYFPVLSVFDISQTDPTDPDADDPSRPAQLLTGEDPNGITEAVTDYLTGQGWTVTREPIAGRANGYTSPHDRRVVIDADLTPAQAAKTALHEAAHAILHADNTDHDQQHRGVQEVEAESVAYVMAGLLGLDTAAYSIGYLAGWSHGDSDTIKATASRVLQTVRNLTDALTGEDAEHTAAWQPGWCDDGVMRVIGRIRKLDENGTPVEPSETDEVSAEGDDYPTALTLAKEKVPDGWQVLSSTVPDHLPS